MVQRRDAHRRLFFVWRVAVVTEHGFTRKTKYIEALCARLGKVGEPVAVVAATLPTKTAAAHLLAKLAGGTTEMDNAPPAIAAQREVSVELGEYGCEYGSRRGGGPCDGSGRCDWDLITLDYV